MVGTMQITDVGRRLAGDILRPVLPANLHVPLAPALALHRLLAIGSTPTPLRGQFGFAWSDRSQRRFERAESTVRGILRATPRAVRVAPNTLGRPFALRNHLRPAWRRGVAAPTAVLSLSRARL
jgi:uncharacterized protein (DUF2236 family)